MTRRHPLRRKIEAAFSKKNPDLRKDHPDECETAFNFASNFYEQNPDATAMQCKVAGKKEGLDPITLWMLYAVAAIAWEVFKAWRNRT